MLLSVLWLFSLFYPPLCLVLTPSLSSLNVDPPSSCGCSFNVTPPPSCGCSLNVDPPPLVAVLLMLTPPSLVAVLLMLPPSLSCGCSLTPTRLNVAPFSVLWLSPPPLVAVLLMLPPSLSFTGVFLECFPSLFRLNMSAPSLSFIALNVPPCLSCGCSLYATPPPPPPQSRLNMLAPFLSSRCHFL